MVFSFGPHIMLDLNGCPKDKLSNPDFILDVLDKLPEKIGMLKAMSPYIYNYEGSNPNDSGITGVVIAGDSHISIHTFPDKEHAFVDIFSCRDFNCDFATSHLSALFSAKESVLHPSSYDPEVEKKLICASPNLS